MYDVDTRPEQPATDWVMQGFEELESIGGTLLIRDVNAQISFPKLKTIGGYLYIGDDYTQTGTSLENLDGLSALESVGRVVISHNMHLKNIKGLAGIKRLNNGLKITSNKVLDSLKGLDNIATIGIFVNYRSGDSYETSLEIANNPNLKTLVGGFGLAAQQQSRSKLTVPSRMLHSPLSNMYFL